MQLTDSSQENYTEAEAKLYTDYIKSIINQFCLYNLITCLNTSNVSYQI